MHNGPMNSYLLDLLVQLQSTLNTR